VKRAFPLVPLTLVPLVSVFLAGCASDDAPPQAIGRPVTVAPGESNVYDVAKSDVQIDRATQRARRTVPEFVQALDHPLPGDRDFAVKKLFIKDGKAEHIWLTDVHFTGNRFVGLVDNTPMYIPGLKLGEKVSVNPNEVSDWMYVRNGQLVGGYTIRVLLTELSPADKADFLKKAQFQDPKQ
jgi:uncharacterized protein YegJ (DUF2314 family)